MIKGNPTPEEYAELFPDNMQKEPIDLTLDETEEDWFSGLTCNPDAPEECESCQ